MHKRFALVRVRDGKMLASFDDWKQADRRAQRSRDNVTVVDTLAHMSAPAQAPRRVKQNKYARQAMAGI